MSRAAAALPMTDDQRLALAKIARSTTRPHREVVRAQALLAAADGIANVEIARRFGTTAVSVRAWRQRFLTSGTDNFARVAPGRGRKATYSNEDYLTMLETLFNSPPPNKDARWSVRSMAEVTGMGKSTIAKIWKSLGIKPHRTDMFTLSNDPLLKEKIIDIVGLYLNPPENALVLCVDEKSSIQALDRTQPSLPMTPGRAGTMTHDYKRHGTSTLFAALDVATGTVISQSSKRHRHQEFMKFLNLIETTVVPGMDIHIVLDNYEAHKHSNIKDWLDKHPRFTFHFTPTSSSWLNQVERFFGILTGKIIRNQAFTSVEHLERTIHEWIDARNENPTPFVWVADAESILRKIERGRQTLERVTAQSLQG